MSLRVHESDLANFFTGLGLPRRASKDLANTVCEFDEVCEALKELVEKRPHKDKPRPEAVSLYEGTEWKDFPLTTPNTGRDDRRVHAIKFSDGSVWDAVNGWR